MRLSRAVRIGVRFVVAIVLLMAGAGCAPGTDNSSNKASPEPLSARLETSTQPVAIVKDAKPDELSIAVSKALFAAAPIVVIAKADDGRSVKRGADQAVRLGVPLLLVGAESVAAPDTAGQANLTPSVTALVAEISRLGARSVLAMDSTVAHRIRDSSSVRVVTDPARLPLVSPVQGHSSFTVLVRGDMDRAKSVAASARAARAQVIRVNGKDLRSDSKAITALAEQKPRHILVVGSDFGPTSRLAPRVAAAKTGIQLPAGGQKLFPGHRLVALYGHPGTPSLGVLGEQKLTAGIARAKKVAHQYKSLSTVPVVPTFEIIATVAQSAPGADGDYSGETSVKSLRRWVRKASAAGLYVVLDLQPGRATFLDQAKRYAELLRLPNVGLALDPEWRLEPGQKPLGQIGGVDAKEINSVSSWLANLTAKHKLPQKLLVLHQFRLSMIRDEQNLNLDHDNIQLLIHMDGQGVPAEKDSTWQSVKSAAPKGVQFGWKNFYDEDHPTLSPAKTMARKPAPLMVSYQ